MTQYHIYSNGGAGGPVDYSTVVATVTSGTTWTSGALAYPGQWTFAVRAFDSVSTLEEQNVDARVSVLLSAAGTDLTALPNAPAGLTVTPTAAASFRVAWSYAPPGQGGTPTGFHVYAGTPTVSYGSPVATVPYSSGLIAFAATLAGLTGGSVYQVAVRSYNATGEESNTTVVSATADAAGPSPPSSLTATVVP